jgi:hypothetical protein
VPKSIGKKVTVESSKNPMEWVGKMHNAGVKYVLDNLELSKRKASSRATIEKEVNRLTISYLKSIGMGDFKPVKVQRQMSDKVLADLIQKRTNCTKKGVDAVFSIGKLLGDKQTLVSLLTKIAQQEQKIAKTLKGGDLLLFQSATALARQSAILCAPKRQGGEGGCGYIPVATEVNWNEVVEWDWIGFECGGPELAIVLSAADLAYQLLFE